MLPLVYIVTGACLVFVGGAALLIQLYVWIKTGDWPPAPLGILWDLAGVDGPFAGQPLPGVFLLLGAWLAWAGATRRR